MSRSEDFDAFDWPDATPTPVADLPAGFALLRPIPVGQVQYARDSEFHAHADLLIDATVWQLALGPAHTVQVAWDGDKRQMLLTPAAHGLRRKPCGHALPDGSIPAYEISVPVYRGFDAPVASLSLVWSAEAGGLLLSWPGADAKTAAQPDPWGGDLLATLTVPPVLPQPSTPAPRPAWRPKGQDLAITVLGLIALAVLLVFLTHLAAPPSRSAYTNTEAIRALVDPQPNTALPLPRNPLQKDDDDAR